MFFEPRQYQIFPGKRDEWVRFMEERIIPGQGAAGVPIVQGLFKVKGAW